MDINSFVSEELRLELYSKEVRSACQPAAATNSHQGAGVARTAALQGAASVGLSVLWEPKCFSCTACCQGCHSCGSQDLSALPVAPWPCPFSGMGPCWRACAS